VMWHNDSRDDNRPLTPTEALERVQRSRREAGLDDYAAFCTELIAWCSRGSISADCAVAWIKCWSQDSK
jgi:hypothetical protein